MDAKRTGPFIAERRKLCGLTQKELADKLQVTDKAISRWETGRGMPETSLLKPLGDILGVSVGELLTGATIPGERLREQADTIILNSLEEKGSIGVMRFIGYFSVSLLVALGCFYSAIATGNPEDYCVGIGMYLSAVIVICTGIIISKVEGK